MTQQSPDLSAINQGIAGTAGGGAAYGGAPTMEIPPPYAPGSAPPRPATPVGVSSPSEFVFYHDNPVPLWSQWDVVKTQTAIDAHTLGLFYESAQLVDAMTMDDAFDAVIQTRVLGLISRPFSLKVNPKAKDKKAAKYARDAISERWETIFPEETLYAIMMSWLMMGFSISQPLWGYRERLWTPLSVQDWHATNTWYDISTRYYVANSMEGPVYLQPGRGDWMLITPFGPYRGWLRGAVRAVWVAWLARQYALRDWARYSEVHGLPIKKLKVPATADAADKQGMLTAFANAGNETTVVLPQGIDNDPSTSYDLELLEAKADTWKAFEGLVTKCETRMAIRMLGQNLTTEVQAGSLAAANIHDRVRGDYVRFDAKAMQVIRPQLLVPFCEYNFGDGELAPIPVWDTKPPADKVAQGRTIAEAAQAAMNFANAQAPVDTREMLKHLGVPVLPPGVKPPPPPDPGQKPEGSPGMGPGGSGGAGKLSRRTSRSSKRK